MSSTERDKERGGDGGSWLVQGKTNMRERNRLQGFSTWPYPDGSGGMGNAISYVFSSDSVSQRRSSRSGNLTDLLTYSLTEKFALAI